MGFFNKTKKVTGRLFDFRVDKWVGYEDLKSGAQNLGGFIQDRFSPEKPTRLETFNEACERLELQNEDLNKKMMEFKGLFVFFLFVATFLFGYAVYMATEKAYAATLISFSLTIYALSMSFRYSFWAFQLKHKKLGCSVREWFDSKISEPK